MSRPGKDVGNSFARQRSAFLLHQRFERAPGFVRRRRGNEADFAVRRHMPALGAVAASRRRRALGGVEFFPVVGQMRQMCAAGVGRNAQISEWIDLGADLLRHLLKLNPVVAEQRIALHLRLQLPPESEKAFARDPLRKVGRQQRRVVIAQLLAEPAEPSRQTFRRYAERHNEGNFIVAIAADDDCRVDALAQPNMSVPRREPIECLERGTIGAALEAPASRSRRPPGRRRCENSASAAPRGVARHAARPPPGLSPAAKARS